MKVTKTIVVVGDSVTAYFAPELADAAAKYGYTLVSAAHAGCPASGKVYPDNWPFRRKLCLTVPTEQDAVIRQYHPALVIWWSRYEVTSRLPGNGQLVTPGSPAYERSQQAAFDARVAALTRRGARVVAIQIEHPGTRARHLPDDHLGTTLLNDWPVVQRWNEFLGSHHGPRVFSIEIDGVVCHKPASGNACDDRLPNGESARPVDGIHYATAAGPELAPAIIARALRAASLPPFGAGTNR